MMTPPSNTSRPGRSLVLRLRDALLVTWMIGVMGLAYVLFEGPVVGSVVKRVEPLARAKVALDIFFGQDPAAAEPEE
jgi:hypothetical protein